MAFAWAGLGATFGAVVVLSLFWKRTTRKGIIAGMLAGGLTVILWEAFGLDKVFYALLPGTIASYLAVWLFSVLDKAPHDSILEEFASVRRLVSADATELKIHRLPE